MAEETIDGRTRQQWGDYYRTYGWDDHRIRWEVGYSFGDHPGDRIILREGTTLEAWERQRELDPAAARALRDQLIDYTAYPPDTPYRRRREREEAERDADGA